MQVKFEARLSENARRIVHTMSIRAKEATKKFAACVRPTNKQPAQGGCLYSPKSEEDYFFFLATFFLVTFFAAFLAGAFFFAAFFFAAGMVLGVSREVMVTASTEFFYNVCEKNLRRLVTHIIVQKKIETMMCKIFLWITLQNNFYKKNFVKMFFV